MPFTAFQMLVLILYQEVRILSESTKDEGNTHPFWRCKCLLLVYILSSLSRLVDLLKIDKFEIGLKEVPGPTLLGLLPRQQTTIRSVVYILDR